MFASIVLWLKTVFKTPATFRSEHTPSLEYSDENNSHITQLDTADLDTHPLTLPTKASDAAAIRLLQQAKRKAEDLPRNDAVTVTLDEDLHSVDRDALAASLEILSRLFSLKLYIRHGDDYIFYPVLELKDVR